MTTSATFAAASPLAAAVDPPALGVAPPPWPPEDAAPSAAPPGGGLADAEEEPPCVLPAEAGEDPPLSLLAVSVGGGVAAPAAEPLLDVPALAGVCVAMAAPAEAVEPEATALVAAVVLATSGAFWAAVDACASFAPGDALAASDEALLLEAAVSSPLPATTRLRGRKWFSPR